MRFPRLTLTVVIFDITLRIWAYLREKARESPSYTARYYWRLFTFVAVLAFTSCVRNFTEYVYPQIPFSLGGGQPRQVVFWLGSDKSADSFLERDSASAYTVPYELLVVNENSFVVISPKDGQQAIEFDRKAVNAMVVLGKRAGPTHFLRPLREP